MIPDSADKPAGILGVLGFLFIPLLYYIWKCYRGQKGNISKDAKSRGLPQMNISGPNTRLVSDIGTKENISG
jgi:hypothetical protein